MLTLSTILHIYYIIEQFLQISEITLLPVIFILAETVMVAEIMMKKGWPGLTLYNTTFTCNVRP